MDFLIKAGQLILSLSILVVLHELGHFIPARLFKTRVEKFYLFFNPWFSLFKFKKGDTEYGIGWLPLGGYVKISGMIDESMDKEQMKKDPEPWEFRAKPAWQRLIIMVGGVTVNIIVGIFLYIMIMYTWGERYLPTDNLKYGMVMDSTALDLGFQDGDKLLALDGQKVDRFSKITGKLLLEEVKTVSVLRNGTEEQIAIPENFDQKVIKNKSRLFYEAYPFLIDTVVPESPASKAGVQEGDLVVGLNGKPIEYFFQFSRDMEGKKNETIDLQVMRKGEKVDLSITSDENAKIGIGAYPPSAFLKYKQQYYTFAESIPAGFRRGKETLSSYVQQLKLVFTPEGAKQIGGFGTFGGLFPSVWDWQSFWALTAFISIILAVMNILPIPALDGGHVMFLLYEIITGRKPHEKVIEYAQYAGMILLLLLFVFANLNDIRRSF